MPDEGFSHHYFFLTFTTVLPHKILLWNHLSWDLFMPLLSLRPLFFLYFSIGTRWVNKCVQKLKAVLEMSLFLIFFWHLSQTFLKIIKLRVFLPSCRLFVLRMLLINRLHLQNFLEKIPDRNRFCSLLLKFFFKNLVNIQFLILFFYFAFS